MITVATAWGPDLVRAIRFAMDPRSSIPAPKTNWTILDTNGYPVGSFREEFWGDWCSLRPVNRSIRWQNGPNTTIEAETPAWAIRPPSHFSDGFCPPRGLDSSTYISGLPFRCARRVVLNGGNDGYFAYEQRGGWKIRIGKTSFGSLPLMPLWGGLSADLLFWSAAGIALMTIPSSARRWRRRQKGHCEFCAYPVAIPAQPCPECGRSASQSATDRR